MSYKRDELFDQVASQSSPDRKYEIRIREDEAGHIWLSCNCKSWTTGPYQKGKLVYERFCKHTDHCLAQMRPALSQRGFVPAVDVLPSGKTSRSGLVRRIL